MMDWSGAVAARVIGAYLAHGAKPVEGRIATPAIARSGIHLDREVSSTFPASGPER